eukprot:GGOE01006827.1.p2 GENE.GGOE01006827.1~~GGOE01006827.1.p2  ORF type:complete len:107 (-),score=20.92 GGOE01006827.1:70-390(-)
MPILGSTLGWTVDGDGDQTWWGSGSPQCAVVVSQRLAGHNAVLVSASIVYGNLVLLWFTATSYHSPFTTILWDSTGMPSQARYVANSCWHAWLITTSSLSRHVYNW